MGKQSNVFIISQRTDDVSGLATSLCRMIADDVSFSDMKLWLLHLGSSKVLVGEEFNPQALQIKFRAVLGEDIPELVCLHFEGYPDLGVAAQMCYDMMRNCEGACATVIDLDCGVSSMVALTDELRHLFLKDGKSIEQVIFCPYQGVAEGCDASACVVRSRLLKALEQS